MTTYEIHYKDPKTGEIKTEAIEAVDYDTAEDYAYMLSDKGWYKVEVLR
jgi:hypothetical protein